MIIDVLKNVGRKLSSAILNGLLSKHQNSLAGKSLHDGKVLVLMLTHLGDCVIHFPFIAALIASSQYANPVNFVFKYPLNEMFSEDGRIRVMGFRCPWVGSGGWRADFSMWVRLIHYLRRQKFDLVVVTHPHFLSSLTARLIGARFTIGYVEATDRLLHEGIPVPNSGHVSDRWKALLARLDIPLDTAARNWHPFDRDKVSDGGRVVEQALAGLGVSGAGAKFICLHPGAGGAAKVWPWQNFVALIERVIAEIELPVVLVGSSGEADHCAKISMELKDRCRIVDLSEQLGVAELFGVFGKAGIYIGNDSGPSHLAAATGIPVFTIFGPASKSAIWQPGGLSTYACQIHDGSFYDRGSVEEVYEHFQIFLNQRLPLG